MIAMRVIFLRASISAALLAALLLAAVFGTTRAEHLGASLEHAYHAAAGSNGAAADVRRAARRISR